MMRDLNEGTVERFFRVESIERSEETVFASTVFASFRPTIKFEKNSRRDFQDKLGAIVGETTKSCLKGRRGT
jgi:hypothetical protein